MNRPRVFHTDWGESYVTTSYLLGREKTPAEKLQRARDFLRDRSRDHPEWAVRRLTPRAE